MKLVTFLDPLGHERVGRLDETGERVVELQAVSMLAWLHGEGHRDAARDHALADVRLKAPVPTPPSVRDFFAYEGHVTTGSRLRGLDAPPPAWYEHPVFYFSNPAATVGPNDPVRRPEASRALDLELEIAAVLDDEGRIAGFTLLDDFSARDVQRAEMTVGLGPAKGKDFATALGPFLVTPDELPYADGRLDLTAYARIDGTTITETPAAAMHWTWPQLVAHAGRDTHLRAGDVLGSGTLDRGCLLELNADPGAETRWLEPGQTVTIGAEGLGELTNPIV